MESSGFFSHATETNPYRVEVANIAETLAAVEGRRGRKLVGPEQVPNGPLIALFTDPDGHVIGLVQAGTMRNGCG